MINLLNNFITIMFSGFWSFIGCLIVLFIMASVFQFLFEKILEFITILLRGYPPAPQITCPREEKNKEG